MEKGAVKSGWPLVGNGHIIEFLTKNIAGDKVAGVYIFKGLDGLGKTTAAKYFARILLDDNSKTADTRPHGDSHIIEKDEDKKNISIEQVREFIRMLSMSSFLNSYKIGIIKDAHLLSEEAANALLKTLEEPKEKVVIILVTSDIDALPATIVSRSRVLNFRPVRSDFIYDYLIKEYKAPRSAAKNFSRLALGRPALAAKFLENKDFYENYIKAVNAFLIFAGDNVNKSFDSLAEIIGAKTGGRESAEAAEEILKIWQGLARDLLLLSCGRADLIQHHLIESELEKMKSKMSLKRLSDLSDSLRRAASYIKANVNPKIVLENIAINI